MVIEAAAPAGEPEVIQPTVSEYATAEAPIVEPEALPDLPGPVGGAEPVTDLEAEPAPDVAESEPVAQNESEPAAQAEPELEVEAEPEPEPEPAVVEAQVEAEPAAEVEPEPEQEPEPEPVTAEPEPGSAITEPVLSAFDDGVATRAEPVTPPAHEFERVPEPEPAAAAAEPIAAHAAPDVSVTLVAWPSGAPVASPGNGAPSDPGSFEEATSMIPAWQQTDPNADAKRTVSLQAMPPEEIASGSGFAWSVPRSSCSFRAHWSPAQQS